MLLGGKITVDYLSYIMAMKTLGPSYRLALTLENFWFLNITNQLPRDSYCMYTNCNWLKLILAIIDLGISSVLTNQNNLENTEISVSIVDQNEFKFSVGILRKEYYT